MKVYLYASLMLSFLIISSLVAAQQTSAGITPDSFLYGLDTALDNIRLLLTFDNSAKARLGLLIAQERLLEVREMILQNKTDAARTAENEHFKMLQAIRDSVNSIQRANATEQIEEEIEFEKEIEDHENRVETLKNELEIKIKIRGNLTQEQQNLIDSLLNSLENQTGRVKVEIKIKENSTKIKIKQILGLNETELEKRIERIEIRKGLFEVRENKAIEQIEDAREKIDEVNNILSTVNQTQFNITSVLQLIENAKQHLLNSELAFNETKFGEAFGQATSAENLAKNAKRILGKILEKEEELEIEVLVGENRSLVKGEIDDREFKIFVNSTDREEILRIISEQTGLAVDQLRDIVEFKTRKEEEKRIEKIRERVKEEIKELINETREEIKEIKEEIKERRNQTTTTTTERSTETTTKSGISESSKSGSEKNESEKD